MNKLSLSILSIVAGVTLLAIQQEWLIINFNGWRPVTTGQAAIRTEKRSVKVYFWANERWKHETIEILWSEDKAVTIKHLIDAWLTWLEEEYRGAEKIALQSALLSPTEQELLVSFDRAPFTDAQATYEKWHWIESLLKTIRDNGIKIQQIRFLVHHQPLRDYHLDFSRPWPLIGFK